MPPLYDELSDQVLPHGSFGVAHYGTQARADAVPSCAENFHRRHVMGGLDVQASGTDQAYNPSFDTVARCPPVSGRYSNVSECGIDPFPDSCFKSAVSQMHSDINALITHGPQFGIDADPIRATHAYRDHIERFFGERSADPANCVIQQGGNDLDVDPGRMVHNLPNKTYGSHLSKRPRKSAEAASNVGLSQPSHAPNIDKHFPPSLDGSGCEFHDTGHVIPCTLPIQLQTDLKRPIRRVHGKRSFEDGPR